ncbi:MAG: DUF6125 family protein [Chloroflexota bacterium]
MPLSDKEIADFYRRSFTVADGLWFLKVEEEYGFEPALEIDNEVWKVLPKIQARFLKEKMGLSEGLTALAEALTTRLKLDGFVFRNESGGKTSRIVITKCPWHETMVKSNRKGLSGRVGATICPTEYKVWAAEFGQDIVFSLKGKLCGGDESCILEFRQEG